MSQLIRFSIVNFRGIVSLSAEPNGNSLTLRGKNGAGKSSAVDALFWALGGSLDGKVVRNGAEKAEVSLVFGDYLVTRRQTAGGKPTLTVKSADGKATFNSPTALLSGFVSAIERQTFSHKKPSEQAKVLRQLAPEIDTTALDAEYEERFDERTAINRQIKALAAQSAGMVVPDAPASVPDDIDLLAIAAKKTDAERLRTANDKLRAAAKQAEATFRAAEETVKRRREELERAEGAVRHAEQNLAEQEKAAKQALLKTKSLAEIDTSEIDAEISRAKAANAERAAQRQLARDATVAAERKAEIVRQHAAAQTEADALTARLDEILAAKSAQLASAKLPIPGLVVTGDTVMLDQGAAGPVEIEALNTASRIKLDVAIAAALGHKLVAVRDASLLDDVSELYEFAHERGVQLLSEIVAKGEPLTAEIVGEPVEA